MVVNNPNKQCIHFHYILILLVRITDIMDSRDQSYHKYIILLFLPRFLLRILNSMDNNFSKLLKHLVNTVNNHHFQYIIYRFDPQGLSNHIYINLEVSNLSMLNKHQCCNLFHPIHILYTEDSKDLKYHIYIQAILLQLFLPPQIQN